MATGTFSHDKGRLADIEWIFERDGGRCGVHVGGCGKPIASLKDATRDEIIPKSYFERGPGAEIDNEWYGEWNTQVMHKKCNSDKGGQGIAPPFKCGCHFRYFNVADKAFYVYHRGADKFWWPFVVSKNAVVPIKRTGDGLFDAQMLPHAFKPIKVPGRPGTVGYTVGGFPNTKSQGHGYPMPCLSEYFAHRHNMTEMNRILECWWGFVKAIVHGTWENNYMRENPDGSFSFAAEIPGARYGVTAPRLLFALPFVEAEILRTEEKHVVQVGDSYFSDAAYRWVHLGEFEAKIVSLPRRVTTVPTTEPQPISFSHKEVSLVNLAGAYNHPLCWRLLWVRLPGLPGKPLVYQAEGM